MCYCRDGYWFIHILTKTSHFSLVFTFFFLIDRLATPEAQNTPPSFSIERRVVQSVTSINFRIVKQLCLYQLANDVQRPRRQ